MFIFQKNFWNLPHDLTHPEDYHPLWWQSKDPKGQETGVKWFSMLNHYGFWWYFYGWYGFGKPCRPFPFWPVLKKKLKFDSSPPSSLIYNWKQEFSKFAPQMEVAVVYGLKLASRWTYRNQSTGVITSYASSVKMWRTQKNQHEYLILDEPRSRKMPKTKIAPNTS